MTDFKDLGQIAKSPLDPSDYKLIEMRNGLKCLLISTMCKDLHTSVRDVETRSCVYKSVEEFNKKWNEEAGGGDSKPEGAKLFETSARREKSQAKKKQSKGRFCSVDSNDFIMISYAVGCGTLDDPPDVQGMAHLVEHRVFMGSNKYPETDFMESFLLSHQGAASNGFTSQQSTSYMFVVRREDADEALDILTDAMKNPILEFRRTEEEASILESEISRFKLMEEVRYKTFIQSVLATPGHPIANVMTGSRQTMSMENLGERAREWHRSKFQARNMVMTLKGPLEMEKLVKLAVKFGSLFPANHCGDPPRLELHKKFTNMDPFQSTRWNYLYYMQPYAKNEKFLRLSWLLPQDAAFNTQSKPFQFLTYLFEGKLPGSLDSQLRKKDWIFNIQSWSHHSGFENPFSPIYQINVELTAKGVREKGDVIKMVFAYIKTLQSSTTQQLNNAFNQMKAVKLDSFHFTQDLYNVEDHVGMDGFKIIKALGESVLNAVNPPETLTSIFLVRKFEEELFRRCLSALNIDNLNLIVGAEEFSTKIQNCNGDNNPLKLQYGKYWINEKFKVAVRPIEALIAFKLPGQNTSDITQRNVCHFMDHEKFGNGQDDVVLLRNERMQVKYSNELCQKGLLPKVEYIVKLKSPMADDWAEPSIVSVIPTMKLWIRCIEYTLETKYPQLFQDPLVQYTITHENPCLQVKLYGPPQGLAETLTVILEIIMNHNCSRTFSMMMSAVQTAYEIEMLDPEVFSTDVIGCALNEKHCLIFDKVEYLEDIDFEGYMLFICEFRATLFIQASISGCVTKADVKKVTELLQKIKFSPWKRFIEDLKPVRAIIIPEGERCLRFKSSNPNDESGMVFNHYQFGILPETVDLMVDKLVRCLETKAFQWLRNDQQLGYSIEATKKVSAGVTGVTIGVGLVLGTKFTMDYINEKIDEFLVWFGRTVIYNNKEFSRYIGEGKEYGESWKWKQMAYFYANFLLPAGGSYRKLSFQMTPRKVDPGSEPLKGTKVQSKITRFATTVPLSASEQHEDDTSGYELDYPETVDHTNGYFITNLDRFKESTMCWEREMTFESLEEEY